MVEKLADKIQCNYLRSISMSEIHNLPLNPLEKAPIAATLLRSGLILSLAKDEEFEDEHVQSSRCHLDFSVKRTEKIRIAGTQNKDRDLFRFRN